MDKKKILVAVDGSIHSNNVIEKAIEFSKLMDADLLLVYCHKKFPKILGEPYREKAITETLYEAEQVLIPYKKVLDESGVRYTERLMEEPAGTVIPNIAELENFDLIIMGSRGLTNLEGLIVGSVTHRVLHLATCPVLVVK